jgi:hypothetical protein
VTTCPSCNTQNEEGAQFCVSCGTPLGAAVPQTENTVACPSCAAANPPGAQFCISCGTPLNAGFMPGADQSTLVSAGRVPEPPADIPAAPEPVVPPPPADATVLASKPDLGWPTPPPPADATVLAANPAAAWPPPPPPPAPMAPPQPVVPGHKELSLALALEILPALVGVFGLGWIYAGNVTAGAILLVAMLMWEGLGLVVALFTLGAGCLCLIPINLIVIALSAFLLYNYTKQHPERFGV